MLRTRGQAVGQLFTARTWFKYMGSLQGTWSIGTRTEKQTADVNSRNYKMGKFRNKFHTSR
jgi:hypothetical protein